ncbi:MAG: hypothetical protein RL318_2048 [Fibrobacterota bacterium]|jgi:esterase/lipase superfamily enzyme/lysophospholipase L1-like esterase
MIAGRDIFAEEIESLRRAPTTQGRVLLYGSSTIRMWESAAQDLHGATIENRGFGGSTLKACAESWALLGKPLRPSAVVIYAGDNDLDQGAQPEEILGFFRQLLDQIHARKGGKIPVCLISIKPSPSRWNLGDRIRRTNRLLEEECAAREDTWFLDLVPCFLDGDLRPRTSAFQEDGLHLTRKGYRVFTEGVSLWLERLGLWNGAIARAFELAPSSPLLPRTLRLHRGAHARDSEIAREYHCWHSPHLGREMELLTFGHAGERMLVFPSRMERFFEWENRGMIHACRERIEAGTLQLWCLDSLETESFFAFAKSPAERIARHYDFERYVLEEVIPFSQAKNPSSSLGAVGCSFGAFHAAAIVFRHPQRFNRLLALSGRFDLSRSFGEDYPDLFQGYREDPLYFLMPTHFLPGLRDPKSLSALRDCEILLAVGEDDGFRPSNDDLSRILWGLGVPHHLKLWVGSAHRFRYWRQMARAYLTA